MNPLDHLPDPDDIGQMEYRAIHTHVNYPPAEASGLVRTRR